MKIWTVFINFVIFPSTFVTILQRSFPLLDFHRSASHSFYVKWIQFLRDSNLKNSYPKSHVNETSLWRPELFSSTLWFSLDFHRALEELEEPTLQQRDLSTWNPSPPVYGTKGFHFQWKFESQQFLAPGWFSQDFFPMIKIVFINPAIIPAPFALCLAAIVSLARSSSLSTRAHLGSIFTIDPCFFRAL